MDTSGELSVVEGELEDGANLNSIIDGYGRFGWTTLNKGPAYSKRFYPHVCEGGIMDDEWEDCNAAPEQPQQSTVPGQVWGLDAPFNFITEYDWFWRYHQYRNHTNDRWEAPVNFRDQIVPAFTPGRGKSRTTKKRAFIRDYDHNCMQGPEHDPITGELLIPADLLYTEHKEGWWQQLSQRFTDQIRTV